MLTSYVNESKYIRFNGNCNAAAAAAAPGPDLTDSEPGSESGPG